MSLPEGPELEAALLALRAAVVRFGLAPFDVERLAAYVAAVVEESTRVNLTGAKSLAVAVEILGIDSLPLALAMTGREPRTIVDLGTGNGLPGIAAALLWPGARTILVDRREKKIRAVERCLALAGLPPSIVGVACDGRDLLAHRSDLEGAVDLVTVRAVGDLASTTREAAPWLARGGRIVHWKAAALDAVERAAGDAMARSLRLEALPDVEFTLGSGAARRLVAYERT